MDDTMIYEKFIQSIKSSRKTAFYFISLILMIYFIFHAIAGNRGIIAYFKINQKLDKATTELDELRSERIELEHRVNLLKSPLDKDMLDEQARRALGVASPNEKVFIIEEKK
jgi:cell division protein FtsB